MKIMTVLRSNKGFTLMEILAVMLVIAVIASFLVPAVRAVRAEIYYQRAKTAAIKMAEAMRSYYRDSKGHLVTGSFSGTDRRTIGKCPDSSPVKIGIPPTRGSGSMESSVEELFDCNYLTWKDFEGLPYTFTASATSGARSTLVTFQALDDSRAGRYRNLPFKVLHNMAVDEADESDL